MGRPRSAVGISQDDLATRCTRQGSDASRGTISHIETGLRGVIQVLRDIAELAVLEQDVSATSRLTRSQVFGWFPSSLVPTATTLASSALMWSR